MRRQTYCTNLSPGEHRFELLAENGAGHWSDKAVLTFRVAAAFYQTVWFRSMVALLATLLLVLAVIVRTERTGMSDRLDGIGAALVGRIEVEEDDIGEQLLELLDGFTGAPRLAHDLHVSFASHSHPQPDAHYRVIVGNHDFDLGLTVCVHGGWNEDPCLQGYTHVDRRVEHSSE
jgi:hypothetical protein